MNARRVGCLAVCVFFLGNCTGWAGPTTLNVSTPAFAQGAPMPAKFAHKTQNISPEIRIGNVPIAALSLVLIIDDPDAPSGLWTHWLMWNMPPTTTTIFEGKVPDGAVQGANSSGDAHYNGPAPPSGTHRYFFHVYALDSKLALPQGSDRAALLTAMKGHVVAEGETLGTYSASH